MNENTEAQTNISPDYPLNFLLAVDNKYRTYYIPADIAAHHFLQHAE